VQLLKKLTAGAEATEGAAAAAAEAIVAAAAIYSVDVKAWPTVAAISAVVEGMAAAEATEVAQLSLP
jgi:hypothetical protein